MSLGCRRLNSASLVAPLFRSSLVDGQARWCASSSRSSDWQSDRRAAVTARGGRAARCRSRGLARSHRSRRRAGHAWRCVPTSLGGHKRAHRRGPDGAVLSDRASLELTQRLRRGEPRRDWGSSRASGRAGWPGGWAERLRRLGGTRLEALRLRLHELSRRRPWHTPVGGAGYLLAAAGGAAGNWALQSPRR